MRSKPILHGQVTQSLLLLPLGSSQRHDIRTARPTPNATRSRRDRGNAQPYPPPPPRGSRRSAARSTRRLGVSRKPQRSSCARDPTGGAHPSERERPPDILKRIPPLLRYSRVVAASQNFRRLLSSPPPPRHSSPPPPGSGGAMGSTRSASDRPLSLSSSPVRQQLLRLLLQASSPGGGGSHLRRRRRSLRRRGG